MTQQAFTVTGIKTLFALALTMATITAWAQSKTLNVSGGQAGTIFYTDSALVIVQVYPPDTTGRPALEYEVDQVVNNVDIDTFGFGYIPPSAFKVDGTSKMILDVDAAAVTDFFNITCTLDLSTYEGSCYTPTSTPIKLVFQSQGGLRQYQSTGTTKFTSPHLQTVFSGAFLGTSGVANGSVLNAAASDAPASLLTVKNMIVNINKR